MLKSLRLLAGPLLIALILFCARSAWSQPQADSSKVPVSTVVTVLGPDYTAPPALGKSDVVVRTGKTREDMIAWDAAQGDKAALELAILIDEGTSVGNQLVDLRNFVQAQSKTTSVGVFYARNGIVQPASQFTPDHDAAAKAIRITVGNSGISMSIYLSLMDLMSRWPTTGARREILVIGDGIDRFRGDPASPDVTSTIEKAQKAGIIIHTLYARVGGGMSRNTIRVSYGQSNLGQMADETGGEAFFQGLSTPISFAPFLNKLDMVLHNQYLLTFTTARSKKTKGELRKFRVTTEQSNVDISAADMIWVPGIPK
jgi:hypothetical protein